MIKRRPHTLRATLETSAGPYQDGNGNMVFPPNGGVAEVSAPCRAESNTLDGRRTVRDGVDYDYSYIVFTDGDIADLPMGTVVEITVNATGDIFGMGGVLKFERGQRVTRVWLK